MKTNSFNKGTFIVTDQEMIYYCNKMCVYFSPLLLPLEQSALEHCAFVSVVSVSLFVFLAVLVLVCTEMLSQRWRRLLGLIIWATHLTMGYTFIFSSTIILPWDQVTSATTRVQIEVIFFVASDVFSMIFQGQKYS